MKKFDIAKIEGMSAVDIYTNGGIEPIMEAISVEVKNFNHDVSTGKGRDATKALSAKVSKAKAAMERAADTLTEEARKTLAKLLGKLFDDSFVLLNMEDEPDQIARMGLGDDPQTYLSIAEAFELLEKKFDQVSAIINQTALFILMINAGMVQK